MPQVDISGVLQKSTRYRRISDLVRDGHRGVQVLDTRKITELIHEAVASSWSSIRIAERRQVERDAKAEFLRLLAEHKRVVQSREELETQRLGLQSTIEELRLVIEDERQRAADDLAFELSPEALEDLSQRLRTTLAASLNDERRLRLVLDGPSSHSAMNRLEDQLTDMLESALGVQRRRVESAREVVHSRQVSLLERRIKKLAKNLERTEDALNVFRDGGDADDGVASIYREIQGLSRNEKNYTKKQDLLTVIFQDNLKLQKKQG